MSTSTNTHLLQLEFDAKQVTQVLMFSLTCNNEPSIITTGAYAGTYELNKGDVVNVEVTATSLLDPEPSPLDPEGKYMVEHIEIVSLDIVSIPNVNSLTPEALSPFARFSATQIYGGEKFTEVTVVVDPVEREKKYQSHIQEPLLVEAAAGFWQLSAYLSVIVHATDTTNSDGGIQKFPRVFTFDPEVTGGRTPG